MWQLRPPSSHPLTRFPVARQAMRTGPLNRMLALLTRQRMGSEAHKAQLTLNPGQYLLLSPPMTR